mgnify:CR=1 FL=1
MKVILNNSKNSVFCYVTGAGTDTTEKGRISWARIKGKTENDLLKLSFKAAYMFRPGYIQPLRGIKSRTKWVSFIYLIFSPSLISSRYVLVVCLVYVLFSLCYLYFYLCFIRILFVFYILSAS